MPNRRFLVFAGVALALGTAGGLLLSPPDKRETGAVRVTAPAAAPTLAPAVPPIPAIPLPAPTPSPTSEPGIDPPPPPQERGSPDYAKLGVQPAI